MLQKTVIQHKQNALHFGHKSEEDADRNGMPTTSQTSIKYNKCWPKSKINNQKIGKSLLKDPFNDLDLRRVSAKLVPKNLNIAKGVIPKVEFDSIFIKA